jgi:hypothetical protein
VLSWEHLRRGVAGGRRRCRRRDKGGSTRRGWRGIDSRSCQGWRHRLTAPCGWPSNLAVFPTSAGTHAVYHSSARSVRARVRMRTLEDASASWQQLKQYRNLADLRQGVRISHTALPSPIVSAGLRSATWKTFLLFQSLATAEWPKTLAASRSAYESLRSHLLRHLDNPDEVSGDEDDVRAARRLSYLAQSNTS